MSESIQTQPPQRAVSYRLIPGDCRREFGPCRTKWGLRWLVSKAHSNGCDRCVRRVGHGVPIHAGEFFAWIDEQLAAATTAAPGPHAVRGMRV